MNSSIMFALLLSLVIGFSAALEFPLNIRPGISVKPIVSILKPTMEPTYVLPTPMPTNKIIPSNKIRGIMNCPLESPCHELGGYCTDRDGCHKISTNSRHISFNWLFDMDVCSRHSHCGCCYPTTPYPTPFEPPVPTSPPTEDPRGPAPNDNHFCTFSDKVNRKEYKRWECTRTRGECSNKAYCDWKGANYVWDPNHCGAEEIGCGCCRLKIFNFYTRSPTRFPTPASEAPSVSTSEGGTVVTDTQKPSLPTPIPTIPETESPSTSINEGGFVAATDKPTLFKFPVIPTPTTKPSQAQCKTSPFSTCFKFGGECMSEEMCKAKGPAFSIDRRFCKETDCHCCMPRPAPNPPTPFPTSPPIQAATCRQSLRCTRKGGTCMDTRLCKEKAGFFHIRRFCKGRKCACCIPKPPTRSPTQFPTAWPTQSKESLIKPCFKRSVLCEKKGGECLSKDACKKKPGFIADTRLCRGIGCICCKPKKMKT